MSFSSLRPPKAAGKVGGIRNANIFHVLLRGMVKNPGLCHFSKDSGHIKVSAGYPACAGHGSNHRSYVRPISPSQKVGLRLQAMAKINAVWSKDPESLSDLRRGFWTRSDSLGITCTCRLGYVLLLT